MLTFAQITIGSGSVHSGAYCEPCDPEGWRPSSDVVSEIAAVVANWDSGSGPNISLGGAEPLNYEGLWPVVRFALQEGVKRIRIETDCISVHSAEDARRILRAGIRHIQFTLLGSDAERHDKVAGKPGAYDAGMAGLALLKQVAEEEHITVYLSAQVPVCRTTLPDVLAIVETAARCGLAAAHLTVVDPSLDLVNAAKWIETACDEGVVNEIWVDVEGIPFGFARGWELHLACVYRPVEGVKAEQCGNCALDPVCGGATVGAPRKSLALFSEPHDAEKIAEMIARAFESPGSEYA